MLKKESSGSEDPGDFSDLTGIPSKTRFKTSPAPFECILVAGLGLMGGSLLKTLRKKMPNCRLMAYDCCDRTIARVKGEGAADWSANCLKVLPVERCDLVVLATPLGQYGAVISELKPRLTQGTVVTDLGSAKGVIHREIEEMLQGTGAIYVGAHPMCGSEKQGYDAATEELYENAVFFVALGEAAADDEHLRQKAAAGKLVNWIMHLGARPCMTDAGTHDLVTAFTSHLPHLTAALLVKCTANLELALQPSLPISVFTAGGFRDTTRIAGASSALWTDILLTNRSHVVRAMDHFIAEMQIMRSALECQSREQVAEILGQAGEMKQRLDRPMINKKRSEQHDQHDTSKSRQSPGEIVGTTRNTQSVP